MKFRIITMRTPLFLSIFLILLSSYCQAQESEDAIIHSTQILSSIDSEYHPNVIGISKNGMIKGRTSMKTYLHDFYKDQSSILAVKTHYRVSVNSKLDYEIGSFKMEEGPRYAQIIIWAKENDLEQRIFEVVYEKSSIKKIPVKITEARNKWMKLCNEHDAKKLVAELYTEDAIYYNRGRIIIGHDKLSQEYSYMENASYSLHLEPKHVEMISDNTAFEIGRCSGSYPLPYLLVWNKQADGNWKVYIDSNY